MPTSDNRRSIRVICVFPIRLHARGKTVLAATCDCSRTGIRLRVAGADLGRKNALDLMTLADAVSEVLGARFEADLHFEMLGTLIRKSLTLVRIGQEDGRAGEVELGCVFETPLSDDEAAMLGLGLPPIGVTDFESVRDVPGPRHRGEPEPDGSEGPSEPRYQAWIHPESGTSLKSLEGETVGLRGNVAVLSMPMAVLLAKHGSSDETSHVAELAGVLTKTYGQNPRLEIIDGTRMIWSGVAEICHVELGEERADVLHVHLRARTAE